MPGPDGLVAGDLPRLRRAWLRRRLAYRGRLVPAPRHLARAGSAEIVASPPSTRADMGRCWLKARTIWPPGCCGRPSPGRERPTDDARLSPDALRGGPPSRRCLEGLPTSRPRRVGAWRSSLALRVAASFEALAGLLEAVGHRAHDPVSFVVAGWFGQVLDRPGERSVPPTDAWKVCTSTAMTSPGWVLKNVPGVMVVAGGWWARRAGREGRRSRRSQPAPTTAPWTP